MKKTPVDFRPGDRVRNIYDGTISTVSKSYWQWYAGGDSSDYTIEFSEGGWNKSTNLERVGIDVCTNTSVEKQC